MEEKNAKFSAGGVHEHEFKEGEEFPACMNCGDATAWKEAPGGDK